MNICRVCLRSQTTDELAHFKPWGCRIRSLATRTTRSSTRARHSNLRMAYTSVLRFDCTANECMREDRHCPERRVALHAALEFGLTLKAGCTSTWFEYDTQRSDTRLSAPMIPKQAHRPLSACLLLSPGPCSRLERKGGFCRGLLSPLQPCVKQLVEMPHRRLDGGSIPACNTNQRCSGSKAASVQGCLRRSLRISLSEGSTEPNLPPLYAGLARPRCTASHSVTSSSWTAALASMPCSMTGH